MNIKNYALILLLTVLLMSCAEFPSSNQPLAASEPGSITIFDEDGNRVLLETDSDNHALIQVFSEQGRGVTEINMTDATYPDKITVRLHLRGLEELTVRRADNTHMISVSSIDDSAGNSLIRQSTINTSGERSIAPNSQEWLNVELVDKQAQAASVQPTIPLEEGYIDVTLPQSFTNEQIREFTIQWVDFYR